MTLLLVLTSLILISIAVWQLTKILELSKPVDYENNEIATDKDNDMQGKLMFLFLILEKVGLVDSRDLLMEAKAFRDSIQAGEVKAMSEEGAGGTSAPIKDDEIPF